MFLKRVVDAAKFYKVDVINSVCGDCMLLDPKLVSEALKVFLKLKKVNQVDILTYDRLPHGFDCTIVDAKKLIESYKYVKNDYEKDNPTFCLRKIKKYKKFHLIADKKIQNDDLSLALDFWEDYEIINIIYNNLYNKKNFGIKKILNFLKKNPELLKINSNLKEIFILKLVGGRMKKIENTIIIGLGNVGALYDKNLKHHVTTHLKSLEILKEFNLNYVIDTNKTKKKINK